MIIVNVVVMFQLRKLFKATNSEVCTMLVPIKDALKTIFPEASNEEIQIYETQIVQADEFDP
ncbi:5908_t:CDS:2, partial [Funneliformis geosporum]